MPEYLSPGVFIEEVPSGLKAIEGISTSTAAFVGRARRGTVPGYLWASSTPALPFTPTGGFVLSSDPAPVLVTSFAEFLREFGLPLPIPMAGDPSDYGYLSWAVRAFFDNGGKRAFISRIVDKYDKPSTLRAAQGVAYRLLRSAAPGDTTVFLTSIRGLRVGDVISFSRHSDGQNALGTPDLAAVLIGGSQPFALQDGDTLKVTVGASSVTGLWSAKPASVRSTAGTLIFPGLLDKTLNLRVGGSSAPTQSIEFKSGGDPATPLSSPPTLDEVVAYLSRLATGVQVFKDAATNQLVIETDAAGSAAQLTLDGPAQAVLALPASAAGSGNVADIDHVSILEIAAQLPLPGVIKVTDNGSGALRIASVATGAAISLQVAEGSPGNGGLSRLGFGATSASGATGSSPSLTISSYDSQSNSISLDTGPTGLGSRLDAGDVYGIVALAVTMPTANAGPKFIARTPGAWSENLNVLITNSDRQPVPILGTATIASGATKLQVQNVASLYVGAAVEIDYSGNGRSNHEITAVNAGTRQISVNPATTNPINPAAATVPTVRTLEIDVVVSDLTGAAPTEVYQGLSWNQSPGSADIRRHYAWAINARSRLVWVQPPGIGKSGGDILSGSEDYRLTTQPASPDGFPMKPTTIGAETYNDLDETWIGVDNGPGQRSGIESLKDLTEARIIAAPGKTAAAIQLALIAQCELLRYRFAILDGELDPKAGSITSILSHSNLYDTSFAAYYQPWVTIVFDGQNRQLPPSGYLAGIYARVDNDRGVWKAPANEPVLNALGLKTLFTTGEQDLLNPRGVNLIRRFDIGGIRVWGGRTLSSDPDLKYINVRRTLMYLEASIERSTQWVVFEPNSPQTWARLVASVSAFLLSQWREGALFGRQPEQAFFVRCDESTMTADDILNGRLICQIGVAIVRPAEFVIFRIEQITNFGATS